MIRNLFKSNQIKAYRAVRSIHHHTMKQHGIIVTYRAQEENIRTPELCSHQRPVLNKGKKNATSLKGGLLTLAMHTWWSGVQTIPL